MVFFENILIFLWQNFFKKQKIAKYILISFCLFLVFDIPLSMNSQVSNCNVFNYPTTFENKIYILLSFAFLNTIVLLMSLSVLFGESLYLSENIHICLAKYNKKWKRILYLIYFWCQVIGSLFHILFSICAIFYLLISKNIPITFFQIENVFISFFSMIFIVYIFIKVE